MGPLGGALHPLGRASPVGALVAILGYAAELLKTLWPRCARARRDRRDRPQLRGGGRGAAHRSGRLLVTDERTAEHALTHSR